MHVAQSPLNARQVSGAFAELDYKKHVSPADITRWAFSLAHSSLVDGNQVQNPGKPKGFSKDYVIFCLRRDLYRWLEHLPVHDGCCVGHIVALPLAPP